jgi:uncharacterized repeat protein (TIGR01451 family)
MVTILRTLFIVAFATVFTTAGAISVSATLVNPSACGAPTGAIEIQVWGGTAPYTFAWSNGATTANIYNLLPGNYSIVVTDALAQQATGSWQVTVAGLSLPQCAQDGHCSCNGSMAGEVQIIEWTLSGTPPYAYTPVPSGYDAQGDPYFTSWGSPVGSTISIQVTDANGCSGISYQTVVGPAPPGGPNMHLVSTTGSCTGTAGGTVTISNVNDPNYFYQPAPPLTVLNAAQQYVSSGIANASGVVTVGGLAPGNYTLVRDWDPTGTYMAYSCDGNPSDRLSFTIPDLGYNCGSLSGSVFLDYDGDCTQDVNEIGLPYQVLAIEPGGHFAISDGDGGFARDLNSGGYTIAQTDPTLVQLCPPTAPVPFIMGTLPVEIDLADSSTVPLDLSVQLESGVWRPGNAGFYWGWVRNLSPQLSGPVTVTMTIDADLTYSSAGPTPTAIVGNTITWELDPFSAYQVVPFNVSVMVPSITPLGTVVNTSILLNNTLTEDQLANNSAVSTGVVVGSYDPNEKNARTSSGWSDELFYINEDEWIDYTIHFQNTGTDTAFTVVVTDTISTTLDLATFQQGVASHAFNVDFKPGRVVKWTFPNILLPDSNVNEPLSHGLVSFRIRPRLPLLPGTVLENIANIYFDLNPPVITEPSVLVAEFSTGVVEHSRSGMFLSPNPATDVLNVVWPAGSDRTYRVLSTDGRTVQLIARPTEQGLQLDTRTLAAGLYILHTNSGTARFVKQ